MEHVQITDIFGTIISKTNNLNDVPFLVIKIYNPSNFVKKLSNNQANNAIFRLNSSELNNVLAINNINPEYFGLLGDLWLPTSPIPENIFIVLVNKNPKYSAAPLDYIKIDHSFDLNIWKPVSPEGYQELGLIATTSFEGKPSSSSMRTVNSKLLKEFECPSLSLGRNTNMNEYLTLSNISVKNYTIDKDKLVIQNKRNIPFQNRKRECSINHEGKQLILKEADNPWYEKASALFSEKIQQEKETKKAEEAKLNKFLKPEKIFKKNYEGLGQKKNPDFKMIAFSLLFLIFFLIIIRFCFFNQL